MSDPSIARRRIVFTVAWCAAAGAIAGPLCAERLVDLVTARRPGGAEA
ncbi:MAG TPA: hypothetical protein VMU78_04210 [Methylocella sp.]|nr:hypothetical protein [Methylocella sp.]